MRNPPKSRLLSRRGNAMIEFALASGVLIPLFLGTFQFGYTFYIYNLLTSQVGTGARYASMRPFRCKNNASITNFKSRVKNVVVYGNSSGTGDPIVPGLSTDNVDV